MDERLVANYLTKLKKDTGLTYKAIEEKSGRSESTVKKLCEGKTEDPRLDTVAPVVYAMGGSLDEMLNPGKSKDELKEVSVISLKESYEFQLATMKEVNEAHINNIRSHYEQHREDVKENYEKLLSDKCEIIASLKEQIQKQETALLKQIEDLKSSNKWRAGIIAAFVAGLIALMVLEFAYLEHGWITLRHLK